jgi:type II secretory pathway component GspD/PulD (secretin)
VSVVSNMHWRGAGGTFALMVTLLGGVCAHAQPTAPSLPPRRPAVEAVGDSVSVRIVDLDTRTALLALARYLDRPVLVAPSVSAGRVFLEAPRPVARTEVMGLVRSIAQTQGLEIAMDSAGGVYRISTAAPPPESAPAAALMPAAANGAVRLWSIPIRYARAGRVAAIVNAVYGRASAVGELGSPGSTLADHLRRTGVSPVGSSGSVAGQVPPPMSSDAVGGGQVTLSAATVIVPDDGTNTLLVRGTENDRDQVQQAVRALDVRPLQVLIEVLIAEVRRDRSLNFGVEVSVPDRPLPSRPEVTVGGASTGVGLGDLVVRVMRRVATLASSVGPSS